jgi:D-amino peptidase
MRAQRAAEVTRIEEGKEQLELGDGGQFAAIAGDQNSGHERKRISVCLCTPLRNKVRAQITKNPAAVKIYISADMEGVAGITAVEQTDPTGQPEYAHSCRLMTGEVAAACEGAFAGGASEIVVNDSHWNMRNLIHEELPHSVRLIRGSLKPLSMNQGLDPSFAAAAFTGYHAPAGTADAILDHTYSGSTAYDVRINGEHCSEARVNAAVAGCFGVPVIFISGDQNACADARSFLPWIEAVEVKRAIGRYAASSLSPEDARAAIGAGMQRAVSKLKETKPKSYAFPSPVTLDLVFTSTAKADAGSLLPGSERIDGRTVRFRDDDFLTVFQALRALLTLGASID